MSPEDKIHNEARWIADQVKTENDLITQRTGWNLTAQTLLIAGMALIEKSDEMLVQLVVLLVPLLGTVFGVLTWVSVDAAFRKVDTLKEVWNESERSQRFQTLNLISPVSEDGIHRDGKLAPQWMPVCFSIFWALVFLAQLMDVFA